MIENTATSKIYMDEPSTVVWNYEAGTLEVIFQNGEKFIASEFYHTKTKTDEK
jgi:hypothetical protein